MLHIRELAEAVVPVSPDVSGEILFRRFEAEPDLLAIAVVDIEGRPVGLVERDTFSLRMASPYGRALYAVRPIAMAMDRCPPVAEASTLISDFTGEVLSSQRSDLLKGFIIVEEGRYLGVGSALALLQAANLTNQRQADAMTSLVSDLALARDAADAANRAKSEFLANMSHEIRTPLNGVLGIAGVLARTPLNERQREMVGIIESSTMALNALLSDLLDIARVEAGRMTVSCEPFGLAEALREVISLFTPAAEEKGLVLEGRFDLDKQLLVEGDVSRLKQILINLVSNAVKFTSHGQVTLQVRRDDVAGSTYLFEVRDTGIGFLPEQKDALFGRFHQADGSITRRFGGSGLGLAISSSLAELMGGSLDAASTPGEGATFTLRLPLTAAAPADVQPAAPPIESAGALDRICVLVADDHATNRRVVELILTSAGADVVLVENGAEAVEVFQSRPFDLVLMDMQMPVMDGLTAIRELRRLEATDGRKPTAILALTANAMPEDAVASRASGADDHVNKPILPGDLLAHVAAAVAGSGERDRQHLAGDAA